MSRPRWRFASATPNAWSYERGLTWKAGDPTKVFDGQYYAGSAKGLVVVQHWEEELKRLVPTK